MATTLAVTPAKTTVSLPSQRSDITTTAWATALLEYLGKPVTSTNITNIEVWMAHEHSASNWLTTNNPLGTEYGSSNGPGIYSSPLEGIAATASTLQSPAYQGILSALSASAPLSVFSSAVVQSPWDAGNYGGSASEFASVSPLSAYATSTGSSPEGVLGGITDTIVGAGDPAEGSTIIHGTESAVDTATGAVSGLAKIESTVTSATFWKRVGVFALGATLTLGGVVLFVATSKTGEKSTTTAVEAATLA